MSNRPLTADEAEPVASAVQLVREAGFEAKANLLDDMLEQGDNEANPELPPAHPARRANWPWPFDDEIELNPGEVLKGSPYGRCHPSLIYLAGVLMHEANHMMDHGEIEAWGNTVLFYELINAAFDGFFRDCPREAKEKARTKKEELLQEAREKRRECARKAGGQARSLRGCTGGIGTPDAGGTGQTLSLPERRRFALNQFPPPPRTPIEDRLSRLANALLRYRQSKGELPRGDNARAMAALRRERLIDLPGDAFNEKGEAIDFVGRPLVYLNPGMLHPSAFDLYVVDPERTPGRPKRGTRRDAPRRPDDAAVIAFLYEC